MKTNDILQTLDNEKNRLINDNVRLVKMIETNHQMINKHTLIMNENNENIDLINEITKKFNNPT